MSIEEIKNSSVAEYSATEAALAELRTRYGAAVFDVSTGKGLDVAKAARSEIRTYRTGLEKMRQELKAPILVRGKLLDDEAKRITAELVALEDPIDAIIKTEEERKAAEKAERERIERERIAGIRENISAIQMMPSKLVGKNSVELREKLAELINPVDIADEFAEFVEEAGLAYAQTAHAIETMIEAAAAQEAEQERLMQESARLVEEEVKRQEGIRLQQEENDRRQSELDTLAADLKRQQDDLRIQQETAAIAPVVVAAAPITVAEVAVSAPVISTPAPVVAAAKLPSREEILILVAFNFNLSEAVAYDLLTSLFSNSNEKAA